MQADLLAQSTFKREEKQETLDRISDIYAGIVERGDCLSLKQLAVNGSDLMECGVKPGAQMGDILAKMLDEVLNVPSHNDKEYLIDHFVKAPK